MNWAKVVDELKVKREEIDTAIRTISETFLTTEAPRNAKSARMLERWQQLRGKKTPRDGSKAEEFIKAAVDVLKRDGGKMRSAEIARQVAQETGITLVKPLDPLRAAAKRGLISMKKVGKAQTSPVYFSIKEG